MKKITYYLLGLFAIALLSSCTAQSIDENGESLQDEVMDNSRPGSGMSNASY